MILCQSKSQSLPVSGIAGIFFSNSLNFYEYRCLCMAAMLVKNRLCGKKLLLKSGIFIQKYQRVSELLVNINQKLKNSLSLLVGLFRQHGIELSLGEKIIKTLIFWHKDLELTIDTIERSLFMFWDDFPFFIFNI